MPRFLVACAMVFSLLAASVATIVAQGTPAATGGLLSELGYPEVVIGASEAGFDAPAEVTAGTVLLTLDNQAPFPVGFSLIQLPEGVSPEDLAPPPAAAGATPGAAEAPSPEEALPPALYDSTWAGGAFALPGGTGQSVVTLTPGQWLLLTPPDVPLPPGMLNVTGEAADAPAAPEGAVSVELDNFQVRLPEQIPAGPQIWSVTNIGDQPHEIFITKTPERLSVEEAQGLLLMPPDATPDPSLPNPEEFEEVNFILPVSKDQTTMVEMSLEPGHYIAVCFIPEKESGEPHAMKGMISIFSVGAEGEEVEPPASPVPEEQESH